MSSEDRDIKAKELWDRLSPEIKTKLLTYFQIWDDYTEYTYEDLPPSIKTLLCLKIDHNHPRWLQ